MQGESGCVKEDEAGVLTLDAMQRLWDTVGEGSEYVGILGSERNRRLMAQYGQYLNRCRLRGEEPASFAQWEAAVR